jgi:hypothetical protein
MKNSKLQLVWDIEQPQVIINDIDISVVVENVTPVDVDAVVEEQDTALVLGAPGYISISDEKPAWVLANQLESSDEPVPGSVLIRKGNPIRLLAIIHDLAQDPTWKTQWITKALDNIFISAQSCGIHSIKMPILGAQHGYFNIDKFITALINAIKNHRGRIDKIWLTVPGEDFLKILSYLQGIDKN